MSKKRQLGNRFDEYTNDSPDTFGTRQFDDDVFAALEGEKVSTDTLDIFAIRADITQPRRIVPREIRGAWNGTPDGVPALLDKWAHESGMTASSVSDFLTGKRSIHEIAVGDAVQDEFIKLIDLASQIFDVGLQQRIGVSTVGSGYQIIYGERRWMAFHCLHHWVLPEFKDIPAKVASVSPWDLAKIQAAENFQRVELNAIEKARQFAKLLIISRSDNSDIAYDAWNALVVDGGCDRPYYAQVADGNIHPIPYGFGAQFEQALGISTGQMRQYRKLLKVSEDYELSNLIWDKADAMDWGEGIVRKLFTIPSDVDDNGMREEALELLTSALKHAIKGNYHIDIMDLITIKDNVFSQFITPVTNNETVTRVTHLDQNRDASPQDEPEVPPTHFGREGGHVSSRFGKESAKESPPSPPASQGGTVTQLPPNPAKSPAMGYQQQQALKAEYLNKRVRLRGGKQGIVFNVETMGLRVRLDDGATVLVNPDVVESTIYVPGEADPETRRVTSPAPNESPSQSPPLRRGEVMEDYEPPAYLADDNGLSVEGEALIDDHSDELWMALDALYKLAGKLRRPDDEGVLTELMTLSTDDIDLWAEMDQVDVDLVLHGYHASVANLLEYSMRHVEQYISKVNEMVKDERERE